jgi:hypothetical protein
MIGTFDADGFLPEGIHTATWTEFVDRFGSSPRRVAILRRVKVALAHLASVGCPAVLVGGSFVTTKANPKDIDLVWAVTDAVDFDALHPVFQGPDGIPAIHAMFAADMFPSFLVEGATGELFSEFFQHTRDGRRVGVVAIDLTTLEDDDS